MKKMRKRIDPSKVKYIDIQDVPPSTSFRQPLCDWEKLFESVSQGMALVFPFDVVQQGTVRRVLKCFQKAGRFTSYVFTIRSHEQKSFLIHPKEAETPGR